MALLGLDGLTVLRKAPGRPYFVSSHGLVRIFTASIDTTVAGDTELFQMPVGVSIVITTASMRCSAAANVAAPATAQLTVQGAVSGAIYPSQQLIGLLIVADLYRFPVGGAGITASSGDIITFTIDAPATGASVSQTAQLELIGYLV